jgi:hypothetical protein
MIHLRCSVDALVYTNIARTHISTGPCEGIFVCLLLFQRLYSQEADMQRHTVYPTLTRVWFTYIFRGRRCRQT